MRRAVFLDRDGVLNTSVIRDGKPFAPDTLADVDIPAEVLPALEQLHERGFLLICVTNQPDVGRGTQKKEVVEAIHAHMRSVLPLDDLFVCYDGEEASPRKKPNPGMILDAVAAHGIDLTNSFMIGDRWRDAGAGHNAGCRTVHIDRCYTEQWRGAPPDYTVRSLAEAATLIIRTSSNAATSGKELYDTAH